MNIFQRSLVIFIIILSACNSSKKMNTAEKIHNTPLDGAGSFDKEGHRGCRGLMPENTIPAMLHALELGVTTLEMDIVFTKDGKAVISHEPFFNHEITTKPDGSFINEEDEKNFNIYKMTYDEVQKFDVGLKPHPRFPGQQKIKVSKPLLVDLLDSVTKFMMTRKRPMPLFNIETKTTVETDNKFHPGPSAFVDKLMAVIIEKGVEDRVIIQSFDFRTLKYLHKKYPAIKTAMLIELLDRRSFRKQITDLGFTPTIYSPEFGLVTDILIKKCHDQQIKIIPWTVDDKAKINELKSMGVDGIITDYPNLFNE
ncbi:MAG: glycerophosphodiester phosphodiesterase [Ferruginibacter sp.]